MQPVVTAAEARALDRATIEDIGLPGLALMETAGRACAEAALRMLGGAPRGNHVAVICGPGNNGGDGFVRARVLRSLGLDAVCYVAARREVIGGDAGAHLAIYEKSGGVVRSIATPAQLAELAPVITGAALAVDALFGVGLARDVTGHFAAVIDAMDGAARVLAIDIPSGLDADTGRVLGTCVRADRTVTMAARKVALASSPGFAWCGDVEVCDIGVPPAVVATAGLRAGLVDDADVAGWLPAGDVLDWKGTRGHVVVIGGAPEMRGAGRLAAMAALRAGAGLVTLAGDGDVDAPDAVMTRGLAGGALGALLVGTGGKRAVVIGPGLGRSPIAEARVAEVLAATVPAVIDADALRLIADAHARAAGASAATAPIAALANAAGPIVITPHQGEAAHLLGTTPAAVDADRLVAARALAAKTRAVVVLKGARTIVCDGTLGDEFCSINPTGSPALGTAGSGDVLAGTIAALLAQGLAPVDAARVGVFVHGRAGEQLADTYGQRGVVSSDLPLAIAHVLHAIPRPA